MRGGPNRKYIMRQYYFDFSHCCNVYDCLYEVLSAQGFIIYLYHLSRTSHKKHKTYNFFGGTKLKLFQAALDFMGLN